MEGEMKNKSSIEYLLEAVVIGNQRLIELHSELVCQHVCRAMRVEQVIAEAKLCPAHLSVGAGGMWYAN